jgi:hypothetical protein
MQVIDERLCKRSDGTGLLGCTPSVDGELWPAYLEKACAAHAGGWDRIDGGQCTHGWALLTGCKEQYTIADRSGDGMYRCTGKWNPNDDCWDPHGNSPHDNSSNWPMAWPEVGGGGDLNHQVDTEELFERMCATDAAHQPPAGKY